MGGSHQAAAFLIFVGEMVKLLSRKTMILGITFSAAVWAQSPAASDSPHLSSKPPVTTRRTAGPPSAKQKFVLDVVQNAVSLPESDPQDRLRVLNTAASVISPIDHKMALRFAREGTRLEAELITSGQTPAVSMLDTGDVDCATATQFAESIPATAVVQAEQSLIGALTTCKQAIVPTQRKLETALAQGIVAPRGLLALMEKLGPKTAWSQSTFEKMFSALPSDAAASKSEAPNFAAMYERMSAEVDKDISRSTGLKLLDWIGKLPDSGERTIAAGITTDAMKRALGDKAYEDALTSDVMARQAAGFAGGKGEIEHPPEETVSILEAMNSTSTDQTDALQKMPPSLRARTAAANGYATGTDGKPKLAEHYFDIAYSALEEVWTNRSDRSANAPAVLEEVNEAAAQVNPVSALQRAQKLSDPSAQAISMLAVARVVAGHQ